MDAILALVPVLALLACLLMIVVCIAGLGKFRDGLQVVQDEVVALRAATACTRREETVPVGDPSAGAVPKVPGPSPRVLQP